MKCLDCGKDKSKKGLYCKSCGYKHRVRPTGLKYKFVKENKGRFQKGSPGFIGFHTQETKNKLSILNKGKHFSPKTEFTTERTLGEKNGMWAEDNVGYFALHQWINRVLGKAKKCSRNNNHHALIYHWANISGLYLRDLSDWEELCPSCNIKEDKKNIKLGLRNRSDIVFLQKGQNFI